MRYLIAVPSLTTGSGLSRYVFSLCKILAKDNELYVVTTHDEGDNVFAKGELDYISVDIRLISLGSQSKTRKYLAAVRTVYKVNPDVIINNYNAVVQYILPFISKKIKIIHVLHNDTDDFYRVASINGHKTNGWIAPTESIASHFNEYTSNRYTDKVTVIPHGVEEAVFKKKNNTKLEIVYAGVLYEHKGVKILPPIIKRLQDKGIDLHFTIIGGGVLDNWLREQFAKEVESGIVTFTGVIDHDKVYEEMSKADIFLYPTHLDAFGLVIAEAMMNGLVSVVTHLPGITDNLISDGKDGYLIKQDEIEQFVQTIENIYKNNAMLRKLGDLAHKKALTKFSLSAMSKTYISYFRLFK